MIEIFALYLLMPHNIIEVGRFQTQEMCLAVKGGRRDAFCKSRYVDEKKPVFRVCWDCLYGCFRDEQKKCHAYPQ